jgi:hypothetical protein
MSDSLCKSEAGSPAERRGVLTSRIVYRAPRSTKGVIYGASVCLHHPPDSFERESGNRPAGIVTKYHHAALLLCELFPWRWRVLQHCNGPQFVRRCRKSSGILLRTALEGSTASPEHRSGSNSAIKPNANATRVSTSASEMGHLFIILNCYS